MDKALEEGLDQIVSKKYEAELRAVGIETVRAYAIAFNGKEVRVQSTEGWKPKVKKSAKKGATLRKRRPVNKSKR